MRDCGRAGGRWAVAVGLLGGLVIALAGCGSSSDDAPGGGGAGAAGAGGAAGSGGSTTDGGADAGADGAGGSGGVACTATGDLDLEGVWAARAHLAITLQSKPGGVITICPADQVAESELLLAYRVTKDASDPKKVSLTPYLCDFSLPAVTALAGECTPNSSTLVTTTLTPGPSLPKALAKLTIADASATLSSTQPGATFSPDRTTFVLGSTAHDAAGLATWDEHGDATACAATNAGRTETCETTCVSDCAAVVDDDSDGYPGVTIEVCGSTPSESQVSCQAAHPDQAGVTLQGSAWIDFVTDPQLPGTVVSSCAIHGNVDAVVQYNIVGGDFWLVGSPLSVHLAISSLPSFDVSKTQSTYEMVRVDGKYGTSDWGLDFSDVGAACAAVVAKRDTLP